MTRDNVIAHLCKRLLGAVQGVLRESGTVQ
jgi:hypothetical protein